MVARLVLNIQDKFGILTQSEKRLAQLLVAEEDAVLTHSATALADRAGVSKATAARLFQRLGYADFNEVKLQAREEKSRSAPFERLNQTSAVTATGRSIGEHLDLELANITRTFEEIGPQTLRQAMQLLSDAPRIWIFGYGPEATALAAYARVLMARLRPNILIIGATPMALSEDLVMVNPKDLLLVLCLPPHSPQLFRVLDYARTSRMQILALADRGAMMELNRYCDLILPCQVSSYALGASPTAMMSMIQLLALSALSRKGLQRSELINQLRSELGE
jgi:DNA-binding MurR/RpiR family transcriptional regulator